MNRARRGLGISLGILATGVISVFYGILVGMSVEAIIYDFQLPSGDTVLYYAMLFVSIFFTTVATYAFTSEIPMHLTRKKNRFFQVLAYILSNTVSTFVGILIAEYNFNPLREYITSVNVRILIAMLSLVIPFIIIAYTITIRSKEKKKTLSP